MPDVNIKMSCLHDPEIGDEYIQIGRIGDRIEVTTSMSGYDIADIVYLLAVTQMEFLRRS